MVVNRHENAHNLSFTLARGLVFRLTSPEQVMLGGSWLLKGDDFICF